MTTLPEGQEKRANTAEAKSASLGVKGRPVSRTPAEMAQLETQETPDECTSGPSKA